MKKKLTCIISIVTFLLLVLIFSLLMTGCSYNQSIGDFDYGYKMALVYEKGEWIEYNIKKWADYDNDMICIWTTDGKVIYSSSVNIILYGEQ